MDNKEKDSSVIKKPPETEKKNVSAQDIIKKLNNDERFDITIKGKDSAVKKWIRRAFKRKLVNFRRKTHE